MQKQLEDYKEYLIEKAKNAPNKDKKATTEVGNQKRITKITRFLEFITKSELCQGPYFLNKSSVVSYL